jgi:hypothetical protein
VLVEGSNGLGVRKTPGAWWRGGKTDRSAATTSPVKVAQARALGFEDVIDLSRRVSVKSLRLFAEKVLPAVQAMPTPINPASFGQPKS